MFEQNIWEYFQFFLLKSSPPFSVAEYLNSARMKLNWFVTLKFWDWKRKYKNFKYTWQLYLWHLQSDTAQLSNFYCEQKVSPWTRKFCQELMVKNRISCQNTKDHSWLHLAPDNLPKYYCQLNEKKWNKLYGKVSI